MTRDIQLSIPAKIGTIRRGLLSTITAPVCHAAIGRMIYIIPSPEEQNEEKANLIINSLYLFMRKRANIVGSS
jgi:hypothetical protein